MNIRKLIANQYIRHTFLVTVILILVYIILRLGVSNDPVLPFIDSVYKLYLAIPEQIANFIFIISDAGVRIVDHQFVFDELTAYHIAYERFIENWPVYLLHIRWTIILFFLIWIPIYSIRRKLLYTLIFIIIHFISVLGELYFLGVIGPMVINDQTHYFLSPTLFGNTLMFFFLVSWVVLNKNSIRTTLQKLRINISIPDSKFNEVIILLFFFMILRDFIIPFFAFKPYVHFLLETTRRVASLFNHSGSISGDQLVGEFGNLALSKHCLGFMTMFVFASMVYLTRPPGFIKTTLIYMLAGAIFLLILNLVRLVILFITVQGENGVQVATKHHEIYNVVIYAFIFALWVIWYEFFVNKAKRPKPQT